MRKSIYIKAIIAAICLITLTCVFGYTFFQRKSKTETIVGEVIEKRTKYILITDEKENDYMIETKDNLETGQIIEVEITNIKEKNNWTEGKAKNIKIISSPEEKVETKEEITTENKTQSQSNNNSEEKKEAEENNVSSSEETIVSSEEDIISYFEEESNLLTKYNEDKSLKQKIKDGFVSIVDFLFYDGTIKGKKFSELSNAAKLKILKLFISIDEKIENHFPGYKEELGEKYKSTKEKAIEKYLDITVKVCENNEETCKNAKEGFKVLKEKFKITWDVIKNIAGSGLTKLKNWYEIWRETK